MLIIHILLFISIVVIATFALISGIIIYLIFVDEQNQKNAHKFWSKNQIKNLKN